MQLDVTSASITLLHYDSDKLSMEQFSKMICLDDLPKLFLLAAELLVFHLQLFYTRFRELHLYDFTHSFTPIIMKTMRVSSEKIVRNS